MKETMSEREKFLQQVAEIRAKIDFHQGTPQKNKTLLQYIQDLGNKELEKGKLDSDYEGQIKKILTQAQQDLAKIKNIAKQSNQTEEEDLESIMSPRPIKEALSSVKVGSFDPESSPILRRLKHNKPIIPAKKHFKQDQRKNSLSNSLDTTKASSPSSPNHTLEGSKTLREEASSVVQKEIEQETPFPAPTPFPVAEAEKSETLLMPASLKIGQLDLEIELPFENNLIRIGRQDFAREDLNMEVPDEFFDPIIPRSSDQEPSEHCVIEQPAPGEFVLRDRFNSQKTYFLDHFVDQEGTAIKDGDEFILPVNINNQLASLSIEFVLK